ncbi:hypothetical protein ABEB36_014318 [Hypothenemus hampei]|uniref:Uncharacterized protein n=1 Tax=Hypothenemus hampei TaxID=57062 RepID=A0ABD1E671_HYPHA
MYQIFNTNVTNLAEAIADPAFELDARRNPIITATITDYSPGNIPNIDNKDGTVGGLRELYPVNNLPPDEKSLSVFAEEFHIKINICCHNIRQYFKQNFELSFGRSHVDDLAQKVHLSTLDGFPYKSDSG